MFTWLKKYIKYLSQYGFWVFKHLHFCVHPVLLKAIENAGYDFAKKKGLMITTVKFDDINKNVKVEEKKAIGRFIWLSGNSNTRTRIYSFQDRNYYYPRIELTERSGVFTLLHELGHYDAYAKQLPNTEEYADRYIYTFIKENLPPFFLWAFQIEIKAYGKTKLKFSDKEAYNYYLQAKQYLKENEAA